MSVVHDITESVHGSQKRCIDEYQRGRIGELAAGGFYSLDLLDEDPRKFPLHSRKKAFRYTSRRGNNDQNSSKGRSDLFPALKCLFCSFEHFNTLTIQRTPPPTESF